MSQLLQKPFCRIGDGNNGGGRHIAISTKLEWKNIYLKLFLLEIEKNTNFALFNKITKNIDKP